MLSVGCAGVEMEEHGEPMGGDGEQSDTLCQQGTLDVSSSRAPIELTQVDRQASHSGTLTVTNFSSTRLEVETELLRFRPGVNETLSITVSTRSPTQTVKYKRFPCSELMIFPLSQTELDIKYTSGKMNIHTRSTKCQ